MNLEKFIETQREMAMELLDFGSSREKSRRHRNAKGFKRS